MKINYQLKKTMKRIKMKNLEIMKPFSVSAYWVVPGLKAPADKKRSSNLKKDIIKKEVWQFIKYHFGLSKEQLIFRCRKREVIQNRQLLHWYLVGQGFGLKEVGQLTGGYDHTTVINSKNTIENLICTDEAFANKASKFEKQFDLWVL